jgi:hypothetical protein
MQPSKHPDGFISYDNPNYVQLADYIPAYDPRNTYGMGGYQGYSVDIALRNDDPDAIQRAHDFGWITPTSQTFIGSTLLFLANERGWEKVKYKLQELNYPMDKGVTK